MIRKTWQNSKKTAETDVDFEGSSLNAVRNVKSVSEFTFVVNEFKSELYFRIYLNCNFSA